MTVLAKDERSPERRAQDDQLAAEAKLAPLELPPELASASVEARMDQIRRRPVAVAGIVEHGLVRPLDPAVILPEHARVIIVAAVAR